MGQIDSFVIIPIWYDRAQQQQQQQQTHEDDCLK